MAEQFKLLYRGEIAEGQHVAVVKKKLGALLKLEGARLDALFTGKPVVLKRAAPREQAARFQAAFKKAGAVLRVARAEPEVAQPAAPEPPQASQPAQAQPTQTTDAALSLAPVGSDVLNESEREVVPERDIDTDHIKLQGAVFAAPEEAPAEIAIDVDFDLAEVGAQLGEGSAAAEPVPELDINFDLAEVGEELGEMPRFAEPAAPVDADFDLAEVGAQLAEPSDQPAAAAPDTSHLQLKNEDEP